MQTSNRTHVVFLAALVVLSASVAHCYVNGPFLDWVFHRDTGTVEKEVEEIEEATSGSRTRLVGWFKIIVLGTGKACFTKQHELGLSDFEEFGEFATSEAFIEFYGEPECEEGARGFAWGKIRADVVAAAYEKGPECLSKVISSVITDPLHQFSHGDVSVTISGEAVGEAVALCEVE